MIPRLLEIPRDVADAMFRRTLDEYEEFGTIGGVQWREDEKEIEMTFQEVERKRAKRREVRKAKEAKQVGKLKAKLVSGRLSPGELKSLKKEATKLGISVPGLGGSKRRK